MKRKWQSGKSGWRTGSFSQKLSAVLQECGRRSRCRWHFRILWLDDAVAAIPASQGYLLVDTKKCQGCATCMLACSLVHEGKQSLYLARIQVLQNPFREMAVRCVDRTVPAVRRAGVCESLPGRSALGRCRPWQREAGGQEEVYRLRDVREACPFTPSRPGRGPGQRLWTERIRPGSATCAPARPITGTRRAEGLKGSRRAWNSVPLGQFGSRQTCPFRKAMPVTM